MPAAMAEKSTSVRNHSAPPAALRLAFAAGGALAPSLAARAAAVADRLAQEPVARFRLTKRQLRAPTLERIAARVKETRDKTFQTSVDGRVVNRTEAIACLGGSALDNEEAYLLVKLMRSLGLVYIEHQARL